MKTASTPAPCWAVITHTDGEVLTAGVTGDHVDLVLMAIPVGYTAAEVEGWLRDLAGVALETSHADTRQRAIPSLLHHTLTGLLFSHAELWADAGADDPCSVVFVDTPDGASFGWVGPATARVRIDGRDYAPQWVHVRDEEGREARAAVLPAGLRAEVTVEHWPGGAESGRAPITVEAEWGVPALTEAVAPTDAPPVPVATPEAPAEAAASPPPTASETPPAAAETPPLPTSLPLDQPGLLAHAADPPPVTDTVHVEAEAAASLVLEPTSALEPSAQSPAEPESREASSEAPRPHPVARWLGRLLNWGRREEPAAEPAPEMPEAAAESPLESGPETSASSEVSDAVVAADAPEPAHERIEAPDTPGAAEPPVSQYDLLLSSPEEMLAPEPRLAEPEETAASSPAPSPPAEPVQPAPPVAAAEPEPRAPEAVPAPPAASRAPARAGLAPAGLAPAGFEDILGRARASAPPTPVAPAEPVAPVTPPAVSAASAAAVPDDVSALPTLSVPLPSGAADQPVEIVHEPVGAHREQFAIPPLPEERLAGLSRPTLDAPLASDDPHAALLELPWLEPHPVRDAAARGAAAGAPRAWPAPAEEAPARPRVSPAMAAIAAAFVVLFGAGWLVGSWQGHREGEPSMVERAMRAVGLGAPRFTAELETQPPGAWVSVDGRELQRRTPVSIELPPGEHQVTFSMPDLGEHVVTVSGRKGESIPVRESLHGSLEVIAADASVPIQVTVDRKPHGYAPVSIESIEPGLHEVMFSGPGQPAWAQTVQVGIRRTAQVVAHPMTSPATGVLQIQATLDDDQGSSPLSGAQVFVDGELRGLTPLSTEVPRGPHSIRVQWRGETAPVQVIDLPGGNQRFATFAFGLDMDQPVLKPMGVPRSLDADEPAMVSATLDGMTLNVVREAWLHVRTSEGLWRRTPMSVMRAPKGVVVSTVFPFAALEGQSQVRWYMSAVTLQGDEYFTEMQRSAVSGTRTRRAPAESGTP